MGGSAIYYVVNRDAPFCISEETLPEFQVSLFEVGNRDVSSPWRVIEHVADGVEKMSGCRDDIPAVV